MTKTNSIKRPGQKRFNIKLRTGSISYGRYYEIKQWIQQTVGPTWSADGNDLIWTIRTKRYSSGYPTDYVYSFRNEKDAIMFALRWLT
jgi:hypothetical protein